MSTKQKRKTISRHPGHALLQAVEDLKACMNDKRYRVDMNDCYHFPLKSKRKQCDKDLRKAGNVAERKLKLDYKRFFTMLEKRLREWWN